MISDLNSKLVSADTVTSLLTREERNTRWSKLAAEHRKLAEEKRHRRELELKQFLQNTALMTEANQKRTTASSSSQLHRRRAHAALSEEDEVEDANADAEAEEDTCADDDENAKPHSTRGNKGPNDVAAFLRERQRRQLQRQRQRQRAPLRQRVERCRATRVIASGECHEGEGALAGRRP